MWTASAYKLFVVEALLLQNGGPLSGAEASDAEIAIENSDNAAGYRLFLDAGGNSGLEAAARAVRHAPHDPRRQRPDLHPDECMPTS